MNVDKVITVLRYKKIVERNKDVYFMDFTPKSIDHLACFAEDDSKKGIKVLGIAEYLSNGDIKVSEKFPQLTSDFKLTKPVLDESSKLTFKAGDQKHIRKYFKLRIDLEKNKKPFPEQSLSFMIPRMDMKFLSTRERKFRDRIEEDKKQENHEEVWEKMKWLIKEIKKSKERVRSLMILSINGKDCDVEARGMFRKITYEKIDGVPFKRLKVQKLHDDINLSEEEMKSLVFIEDYNLSGRNPIAGHIQRNLHFTGLPITEALFIQMCQIKTKPELVIQNPGEMQLEMSKGLDGVIKGVFVSEIGSESIIYYCSTRSKFMKFKKIGRTKNGDVRRVLKRCKGELYERLQASGSGKNNEMRSKEAKKKIVKEQLGRIGVKEEFEVRIKELELELDVHIENGAFDRHADKLFEENWKGIVDELIRYFKELKTDFSDQKFDYKTEAEELAEEMLEESENMIQEIFEEEKLNIDFCDSKSERQMLLLCKQKDLVTARTKVWEDKRNGIVEGLIKDKSNKAEMFMYEERNKAIVREVDRELFRRRDLISKLIRDNQPVNKVKKEEQGELKEPSNISESSLSEETDSSSEKIQIKSTPVEEEEKLCFDSSYESDTEKKKENENEKIEKIESEIKKKNINVPITENDDEVNIESTSEIKIQSNMEIKIENNQETKVESNIETKTENNHDTKEEENKDIKPSSEQEVKVESNHDEKSESIQKKKSQKSIKIKSETDETNKTDEVLKNEIEHNKNNDQISKSNSSELIVAEIKNEKSVSSKSDSKILLPKESNSESSLKSKQEENNSKDSSFSEYSLEEIKSSESEKEEFIDPTNLIRVAGVIKSEELEKNLRQYFLVKEENTQMLGKSRKSSEADLSSEIEDSRFLDRKEVLKCKNIGEETWTNKFIKADDICDDNYNARNDLSQLDEYDWVKGCQDDSEKNSVFSEDNKDWNGSEDLHKKENPDVGLEEDVEGEQKSDLASKSDKVSKSEKLEILEKRDSDTEEKKEGQILGEPTFSLDKQNQQSKANSNTGERYIVQTENVSNDQNKEEVKLGKNIHNLDSNNISKHSPKEISDKTNLKEKNLLNILSKLPIDQPKKQEVINIAIRKNSQKVEIRGTDGKITETENWGFLKPSEKSKRSKVKKKKNVEVVNSQIVLNKKYSNFLTKANEEIEKEENPLNKISEEILKNGPEKENSLMNEDELISVRKESEEDEKKKTIVLKRKIFKIIDQKIEKYLENTNMKIGSSI